MADKQAVTTEEGDGAADALMNFWRKGRDSRTRLAGLRERNPEALRHGRKQETLVAEADAAGLNPDLMKKAWRLAEQYQEREMEAICQRVREKPARFGYSHMVKLLGVADRALRRELLDAAIDGRWSVSDLQRAIQGRTERRADVGKKPRVPEDPIEVLLAIQGLCMKFNRFCDAALSVLPRQVKDAIRGADKAVRNANAVVAKSINRLRKGRGRN